MSKQTAKRLEKQIKEAQKLVAKQPESARYRKSLGALLTDKGEFEKAKEQLDEAIHLKSDDHEAYSVLGKVLYNLGDYNAAVNCLKKSLDIKPGYHKSSHYLSYLLYNSNKPNDALAYIEQACLEQPKHPGYLITYGNILESLHRYEEAAEKFKKSLSIESDKYYAWNNLGNIYKQLGRMEDALYYYSQAFKVNPQSDIAYSNKITTLHYIPSYSLEKIAKECRGWDRYFNKVTPVRAEAQDKSPEKKLRIGLISDGFRRHPVGYMITSVMEEIANYNYELFFYPTNYDADSLTERLQKVAAKWQEIKPLGVEQTENLIREDQIDILIDLAGHNSGNRMLAIAKEPAPIIMKWVGGLINTTGVKAIDYLISDHIETPSGIDEHYVENIIRLPDDYICYDSPGYAPNTASLPASVNGYITFGCFNNPTKINSDIVAAWADILLAVPGSRMFLKGMQFSSDDLKKRVTTLFGECGIPEDRLIIEGPSAHKQLLESYHKVDIALDPWPYSGGLTTCEALLMGVPVITLPGPTFAGRHSATHLVNAGLGELVADTWEAYKQRAVGLASDLDSLSIIRKGLRQQLLDSPVCDATRFARQLNTALRAAWQRYCEGKAPAALTLEQGGDAYFEGDTHPIEILCSEPIESDQPERFSWELPGKIVVIDNSSKLIREDRFNRLRQVNAFGFVAFDPGSRIDNPAQFEGSDDVQLFQHASLGNGEPATLYACLDEKFSSTLDPLPIEQQHGANPQGAKVLAKLPINTIALDSINGLESLDWLILDDLSDATAILENGVKALKETLVIQVRIAFNPSHHRQPNIAEIQHWMARHGFRFYRFNDEQYLSHLSDDVPAEKRQATELQSAEAIFLPSHGRMTELNDNQRIKLAFLLHTVYGIKDMAYALLASVDEKRAQHYLVEDGMGYANKLPQRGSLTFPSGLGDTKDSQVEVVESNAPQEANLNSNNSEELVNKDFSVKPVKAGGAHADERAVKLWVLDEPIYVVDVGANPIDGTPPYSGLLKRGLVKLVGFEPQKDALEKLQAMKGPNETYLPHAVGTGKRTNLYICQASGMTSTLKPNNKVLDHFQGYPVWGKVKSIEEIDTVRLDDVAQIEKVDWLKIDIQGGELNVFKNAEDKLKKALVIQTEVNFIQLYENQPLFAEIDQWMRDHGFMLHTLLEQRKRLFSPMKINGGVHQGVNQLTTADAVYVRDINSLDDLCVDDVKKMAFILHEAYGSFDLSLRLINNFISKGFEKKYIQKFNKRLPITIKEERLEEQQLSHCFVVGCGHTGTTLMATILGENDSIYSVKRETGWFLGSDEVEADIEIEEKLAKSSGNSWLCEKTPRHVYRYKEIVRRFPDARFIVMTRGAKDVVASIKNRTGDFLHALNRWLSDSEESLEICKYENAFLVRYEDVVLNPINVFTKVCGFLGVEFSDEMLNYHNSHANWFGVENPRDTDGKGEKAHLERRAWQMHQPIQDRRGIWKDILTHEEAETVDAASRRLMLELGYEI